jgi:hypothetical protein
MKIINAKEWNKLKNLSGCFSTTYRNDKGNPNMHILKSLYGFWGSQPKA